MGKRECGCEAAMMCWSCIALDLFGNSQEISHDGVGQRHLHSWFNWYVPDPSGIFLDSSVDTDIIIDLNHQIIPLGRPSPVSLLSGPGSFGVCFVSPRSRSTLSIFGSASCALMQADRGSYLGMLKLTFHQIRQVFIYNFCHLIVIYQSLIW